MREAQAMGASATHPQHRHHPRRRRGERRSRTSSASTWAAATSRARSTRPACPLAARTLEIAKGVCRGLAHAHQHGVVHRDLKPGNVWLTADGAAKIGDFGLAVALEQLAADDARACWSARSAYMPPEQALGGEVTPRADLYSLGCMLYELVTGTPAVRQATTRRP